jgi:hypothetical protein
LVATVVVAFGTSVLIGAAVAQAASVPTKCPKGSALDSAAGTTLKLKVSEGTSGFLLCTYSNKKYGNVTMGGAKVKGLSASEFAAVVKLQSKKTPLKHLSGIGSVAYEFTQNDASNDADSIATTGVFAIIGSEEFDVLGDLPAKNIVAIAKAVVG